MSVRLAPCTYPSRSTQSTVLGLSTLAVVCGCVESVASMWYVNGGVVLVMTAVLAMDHFV